MFQTIVTEELPKTSDAVTSLSKYIMGLIITSAIGIFESVIVERFFRTFHKPPPWHIFRMFRLVPVLWRELPKTHPTYEEAEKICKGYYIAREMKKRNIKLEQKEAKRSKRKRSVGGKRKSNDDCYDVCSYRCQECTSPVFTPIKTEQKPLLPNSETFCSICYREYQQQSSKYAAINYAYENDETSFGPIESIPLLELNQQRPKNYQSSCSPESTNSVFGEDKCCEEHSLGCSSHNERMAQALFTSPRLIDLEKQKKKKTKTTDEEIIEDLNACLWMELGYKIDTIFFFICFGLSTLIPFVLFVPLAYFDDSCAANRRIDYY